MVVERVAAYNRRVIDLDSIRVEVDCPECSFSNPVTIGQVRLRRTVICRGCHSNLDLQDSLNTVRKVRAMMRRASGDLEGLVNSTTITLEL